MGATVDFLTGLAVFLDSRGVGKYRPTGVYVANETGWVFGGVPGSPDAVIVATKYGQDDDPTQAESTYRVQLRTRGPRGDLRTSEDLQDTLFDVLHNLPRQTIGGITVRGAWRRSIAYLGVDGNGRHSHTGNYEFPLHRPTAHRL